MMITVFISFYLFVIVKTSYDDLQVQTEKIGENVVIKCEETFIKDINQYSFAWFKQSYGKLPQLVVRFYDNNSKVRQPRQFIQRFNATLKGDQFFLNIQETVEEDSGTYFCARMSRDVTEFGSGTLLIFNEEKSQKGNLTELKVKSGKSAGSLQCSVLMATLSCSGDHSVYWFRPDSGEPRPGIIFTHGDSSSQCTACGVTKLHEEVKTSNDDLQVQTEKIGENVSIKCEQSFIRDHQYSFAWYKQSYGKLPQFVVRLVINNLNVRYNQQFQQRFNTTLKGDQFVLNIQETVEEDSGTYFCVRVKTDVTEFGSGTLLIFNEKSQKGNLTELKVKSGKSAGSLQCSVLMATLSCSGDHSVYWFRPDSGEPRPGINFTHETELHEEGDCTGQMFILIWLSNVRTAVVAVMLFIIAVIYSVKKIKK
ncbi:uncharacterized protein LOC125803841 isoform X2 [Astyanax mexicanus]|uniref:uncharacterized protein LOC125803841 isoform X2 n=1 Tax=Astyanax mexicanus TaxID=7994 RepID=UPI0020CB0088|nr:uncharacterized protein LOC125803841 isoform X2 [Astyanax mexicanus]